MMSGPIVQMPEGITAEMHYQANKLSQLSERTSSTLATSISMRSMVTAIDEDNLSIESLPTDKDQAIGRGQPKRSILRVRTLSDSLESPDISHSVERRSVGFDSVEIREHGIILGCNPGVSAGVPTTIDWKFLSTAISSLHDYESNRAPRRSILFLKTTKRERERLLKGDGYSSEELLMVENEVELIRRSREDSATEKTDLQAMMAESKRKKAQKLKEKKRGILGKIFGRR